MQVQFLWEEEAQGTQVDLKQAIQCFPKKTSNHSCLNKILKVV